MVRKRLSIRITANESSHLTPLSVVRRKEATLALAPRVQAGFPERVGRDATDAGPRGHPVLQGGPLLRPDRPSGERGRLSGPAAGLEPPAPAG